MQHFLDTGSLAEIEVLVPLGVIDGVTTRPSRLAKERGDPRDVEFGTEVLVARVRHPVHAVEAVRTGADICTCPAAVIDALFTRPLTDLGLERFLKDWERSQAAAVKA